MGIRVWDSVRGVRSLANSTDAVLSPVPVTQSYPRTRVPCIYVLVSKTFCPHPHSPSGLGYWVPEIGVDANFSIKLSGKLSVVVHACNPRIWEAEAEGLGNQGHLQQHSKCEDLGYIKPVASRKKTKIQE